MPSWLCKIWNLLANVLGKIVDFILGVVKKIIDFVVDAIEAIADAVFGSGNLLLFLGLGLLAYFVITSNKEDDSDSSPSLPSRRGYVS